MAFLTTETGHIRLAKQFLENNTFWLARGTLPVDYKGVWDLRSVPSSLTKEVTERVIKTDNVEGEELSHTPVYDIVSITSLDESVEYTQGVEYILTSNTVNWRGSVNDPNTGDEYLVTYRYVDDNITSLLQEVDTMKASVTSYCIPDDDGIIEAGGQRWTATRTPSKYVYLFFKYPADISIGQIIYQCGVYTNREIDSEFENRPVLTEKVTVPGDLILIDNIAPFTQSDLIRQYVEIVLEF